MSGTSKVSYNSSITRVRPVFQRLMRTDKTGLSWLPKILMLASLNKLYAKSLSTDSCNLLSWVSQRHLFDDRVLKAHGVSALMLEQCFEHDIEPTKNFLEWLINNADQGRLLWPDKGNAKFGTTTQIMRENLFGKRGLNAALEAKHKALAELDRVGSKGSRRRWWAFEGFTSVDCYLETESFVLVIEGKRTEKTSSEVQWYPNRNQLIRNLEVTSQAAAGKKFAVLAIGEETVEDPDKSTWISSLPHLNDGQRQYLQEHYLGHTTWAMVCEATGINHSQLPYTVYEAIHKLTEFGYAQN